MKLIPLTQGYFAQVDDADFEKVSQFKWQASVNRYKDGSVRNVYAQRMVTKPDGGQTSIMLHRFILKITDSIEVDHEDHDGRNCQKYNLRSATLSQNQGNAKVRKDNSSGFKGVSHFRNKWHAMLQHRHLGYFDDKIAAARRYDQAAVSAFGEFALTNEKLGLLPTLAE